MNLDRSIRVIVALAAAALVLAVPAARAQQAAEVSFYYPVAVGGPITKIIDGYAADFEKENPGIKVKPIYAGTYQETIVKALTALKSGDAAGRLSVLLSTDMFTLIDEDAIVPIDDFVKTRRRQGLAQELLPGLHAEQPDRRQDLGHPVPALDHRALLEQGRCSRRPASTRTRRPPTGPSRSSSRKKLTKRDAPATPRSGASQIPSSGFPYWLFQGLDHAERRAA